MLSVAEAQKCVLEQVHPLPPRAAPLGPELVGLVLAEDVVSDLDMPPFTKALMDGYAVRSADLPGGAGVLSIVDEITAGKTPSRPITTGQAARIMTGAPLPDGADAVVMIERSRPADSDRVLVEDPAVRPGLNVMQRGQEMRRGEVVLTAGARLRPQELGLLATVGHTTVRAHPRPTVAVVPTGDEIVEADRVPGPGQIRNGNGAMLLAQVSRAGALPRDLGIAPDREDRLRSLTAEGLRHDVLILSGGVSAGKLDLVPKVLEGLGVRPLFHKVAMKPGKPLLFSVLTQDAEGGPPRLVFGLPGNPVSSYVCFELFVRPALRALMGLAPGPRTVEAALAEDFTHRADRPTYHPARLRPTRGGWCVKAVPWLGSPDLRGVTAANAFVILPAGETRHRAGDLLPVLCVEDVE
jgi:molybdopterin molybdotransferase